MQGTSCCERAHEQWSPDFTLPTHLKFSDKYKKYTLGAPNIENAIENVIVFLYFW